MYTSRTPIFAVSLALTACTPLGKDVEEGEEFAEMLWEQGENDMTALSHEERQKRLGYTPGTDEPGLDEAEQDAADSHADDLASGDVLDTEADWRDMAGESYVNPVRDQGSCRSCVAFATTAVMNAAIRIGMSVPVSTDDLPDVSVGQLAYCGQVDICDQGWAPQDAVPYMEDPGLTTAVAYPYTDTQQDCDTSLIVDDESSQISGYTLLTDRDDMTAWLDTKGPLIAELTLYDDIWSYNGGIYHTTDGATADGGHAVAVIGYGVDTSSGVSYWIVQNSWGTGWGEEGYFKIAFGQDGIDDRMAGIEPGTGYTGDAGDTGG